MQKITDYHIPYVHPLAYNQDKHILTQCASDGTIVQQEVFTDAEGALLVLLLENTHITRQQAFHALQRITPNTPIIDPLKAARAVISVINEKIAPFHLAISATLGTGYLIMHAHDEA